MSKRGRAPPGERRHRRHRDDESDEADGNVHPEHPLPAQVVGDEAAEERADDDGDRER